LDIGFKKIENNNLTTGLFYWNLRAKFYITTRENYEVLKEKQPKRINRPLSSRGRPSSMYSTTLFPVTLPKPFRRSFTRIKKENGEYFTYKNVRIFQIIGSLFFK
jgi:hypothetical protein